MLYAVSILLTLGIFILDLLTPLGYEVWLLYFIPILIISRAPRLKSGYVLTAACMGFTVLGYFLSPPGIQPRIGLFNRTLFVGILGMTAVILAQRRQILEKLNRAHEGLEGRVRERTAELKRAGEAIRKSEARLSADLDAMTRLHAVSTRMIQQGDFGLLLEDILEAAIGIAGADFGNVQMLDLSSGALNIAAHRGFERPFLEFFQAVRDEASACGQAMKGGDRVIVEDVTQSPIFTGTDSLEVLLTAGVRSVVSTPLHSLDGRLLGMMSTHWRVTHRPEERVLRLMDLLARQAADAIERIQAREEIRRQNTVLEGINRILLEAISCESAEDLGRFCLSVSEEITQSRLGFIGEIGPDGLFYDLAVSDPGRDLCTMYDKSGHRRPLGDFKVHGLYGRVLADGRSLLTNAPADHPDSIGTTAGHPSLTAFLGVPLIHEGKTVGMIGLGNREGGYRPEDLRAVEAMAPAVVQVILHKRAEEGHRKSEERYRRLFEHMREGFAYCKMIYENGQPRDFLYLSVNAAFEAQTGLKDVTGKRASEVIPGIHESDPGLFEIYGRVALGGEPEKFEFFVKALGHWFSLSVHCPEPEHFVAVFDVITERKRAEEALRRREEDLNRAQWVARTGNWQRDVRGNELLWSDETYRMFGIPKGTPMTYEAFLSAVHPDDREYVDRKWEEALRGEPYDIEHRIVVDQEVKWVRERAELEFDSQGAFLSGFGTVQDVTERKRMEEALKSSLEDKDVLLRELAHRTKNNMQVIASLLGLQAAELGDAKLVSILSEAQNRIQAMALAQERLYRSGNVSSLNMKEYVRDLVASLIKAHRGNCGTIRPVLDLEAMSVSLDAALPCGLIINELVSNSLKYAFPNRGGGTLFLSLRRTGEEVTLAYRDDGPGLPQDLDLSRVKSLGLKLVYNLAVRQLRGTMELMHNPSTEFVFSFRDVDLMKGT